MKVIECDPGTAEWHRARAGAITASKASMIRARLKTGQNKGDFSAKAHDYAFQKAIERISGEPLDDDEYAPWQGDRGLRLEPEARAEHEVSAGVIVQPCGLVLTDDGKFGATGDGLIGDEEGAEYKCFLSPTKLRGILVDGDVTEVMDQCQFGMALTARRRWHFGLYCPALRAIGKQFTLHIIQRDEGYIDAMWADLLEFDRLVMRYEAHLRGA